MSLKFYKRKKYPYAKDNLPPITSQDIERAVKGVSQMVKCSQNAANAIKSFTDNISNAYEKLKETMSRVEVGKDMPMFFIYRFPQLFNFVAIKWKKAVNLSNVRCATNLHLYQLKPFKIKQ